MNEPQQVSDTEIAYKDIKSKIDKLGVSVSLEYNEQAQQEQTTRESKLLELQIQAQEQYLNLQKDWAKDIKKQLWTVLLFQFLFVIFVGWNIWGFTDNINKLPYMYILVILQSLANFIALGFVVAKFLFPNQNPSKK